MDQYGKFLIVFVVVMLVPFIVAMGVESFTDTRQMEACVAADKSWVDNPDIMGVQMECR